MQRSVEMIGMVRLLLATQLTWRSLTKQTDGKILKLVRLTVSWLQQPLRNSSRPAVRLGCGKSDVDAGSRPRLNGRICSWN